ncbi:lipocalin-like domain-containing protein [Dyadobacter luticola]|uniref:Uncharacterized protein n=1 Tax=Dyadobacter luticola TaxID=1979387 RepID=A0A5R9L137_9BACT|nr:lipocalin-like domain-containing protein [Dyadobacter luticola]TLV02254.1 hypothetical protein FEN17_01025 [Dyadobacter luticola]
MKHFSLILLVISFLTSCDSKKEESSQSADKLPITGTWQLLQGTLIEKGDTTVTRYAGNISFIKILNDTHFSFLQHDLTKGKDSSAVFVAGGGAYTLKDSTYTEHLEYCSARDWEGNDFTFTIEIKGDTLVQRGVEKVAKLGIERVNVEKYVRLRKL